MEGKHGVLVPYPRYERLRRGCWTITLGGWQFVIGGVLWASLILTGSTEVAAETKTECRARVRGLIQTTALVEEKKGQWVVPASLLKSHPLLLRNLVVFIYNHPFITPFFSGFEKSPRLLHYAEKGPEVSQILARLDQDASFAETFGHLRSMTAAASASFELDFSKVDADGVVLRFLTAGPRMSESEKKLRAQFAESLMRYLSGLETPLALRSFHYVPVGRDSFLVEPAFFLKFIYAEMLHTVTGELMMPRWKPFQESFLERFPQKAFEIEGVSREKNRLTLTARRSHPSDSSLVLYEVRPQTKTSGDQPPLEMSLLGQPVEWYRSQVDEEWVGIVALPSLDDAKSLTVMLATLGGYKTLEVKLTPTDI